jgi:glycosyltransferase involved in cell wall biosynthesis
MNKKKKISHLITGLEVGGAEMMLLKTLPLLQKDFENEVYCIKGHGPIGKKLEQAGIAVCYLGLNAFNLPVVSFKLARKLINFKPDLLVTYLIHADIFGRIIGRICGIKKIICNQRGFYLNWKFLRVFDRWTKFLVTKYFVQTKFAREVLMKLMKLPKERFEIVPNTIIIQDFKFELDLKQKKEELKLPQENLNIVSVGTLKPRKGFEEILEAFEKTYQNFKNISLLIVGNGDQKTKYLDQIKKYSSKNNIIFLGKRDDVKEILRLSDIFVLGTYSEGMSNAILEAMASKLAIITTDIEVNRELIENNDSGILVPIKNPAAIAEKLEVLIKDEEKRKYFGEQAYDRMLEKFEIGKVIELTRDNYEKIINES